MTIAVFFIRTSSGFWSGKGPRTERAEVVGDLGFELGVFNSGGGILGVCRASSTSGWSSFDACGGTFEDFCWESLDLRWCSPDLRCSSADLRVCFPVLGWGADFLWGGSTVSLGTTSDGSYSVTDSSFAFFSASSLSTSGSGWGGGGRTPRHSLI